MKKLPPNATTWTAVSLIALGLIMIFLAWNGAAGADAAVDIRAQFPYLISGGVFGIALVGAGLTLVLVFEGRRDSKEIVAHLARLTDAVTRLEAAMTTPQAEPAVTVAPPTHEMPPPTPAPVGTGAFEPGV